MSSKQVITFTNSGDYIFNGKTFSKDTLAHLISTGSFLEMIKNSGMIEFEKDFDNADERSELKRKLNYYTGMEIKDKDGKTFSHNRIIFGAPGTGKSYTLNSERMTLLGDSENYERVTFHPDYSYAQFVGTYKPVTLNFGSSNINANEQRIKKILEEKSLSAQEKYDMLYDDFIDGDLTRLPILLGLYTDEGFESRKKDGSTTNNNVERNHGKALRPFVNLCSDSSSRDNEITYEYVPGPFMRMYVKAVKNARTENPLPHLLIIEEINRANVTSVFGDIFQLLDRDDQNASEYEIETSEDIRKYLVTELGGSLNDYTKIKIPDNLYIWATMNSADQGVFPMDTAFKRRWDFKYIGIDEGEDIEIKKSKIKLKDVKVKLGKGNSEKTIKWNDLRKAINDELSEYKINEDKLLGPFFLSLKLFRNIDDSGVLVDSDQFIEAFKSKVIMYLFEDAARQKRFSLFSGIRTNATKYSSICNDFQRYGIEIFSEGITNKFINNNDIADNSTGSSI